MILAAPSSGSGKTTVTLGLLRALRQAGVSVRGAKSGPDYIDPRFHEAACGVACLNLDAWAMPPAMIRHLAREGAQDLLLIEGAMGLFDGAPPDGRGSAADLARELGLPVVLVVDAAKMAQSVAPLVAGFARHDAGVRVAGVILNRVGSPRHTEMLRRALAPLGLPVLGAVPRLAGLAHPDRHLGLVQAEERSDLDSYLDRAADEITMAVDLQAIEALAAPLPRAGDRPAITPPGQRIAIARDRAFAFAYPHHLRAWQQAGATVLPFSPLADDPVPEADFVYLPGGYPELHAGVLASNTVFLHSLRRAAETATVYGECGGYMTLGDGLIDADGVRHQMAGLLRLETSFAKRRLHLGYRYMVAVEGPMAGQWTGHEFHYATTIKAEGTPLFALRDAENTSLGRTGLRLGSVSGAFTHIIAAKT